MTEREKKEIYRGYADLIIKKEKLIQEIWETECGIKKIESIMTRNRILKPTETEAVSYTHLVSIFESKFLLCRFCRLTAWKYCHITEREQMFTF